jgi:xanthine/uracil/vitamin C permease (AzgA family)
MCDAIWNQYTRCMYSFDSSYSFPYLFLIIFLVAFVYGIIFPAYYKCINQGDAQDKRTCQELAWHIALGSNFIVGIIIIVLCLFGELIRRNIPGVALLSSISAIGFTYLALNQFIPIASIPMVSFLPFSIVILGYCGKGSNKTTITYSFSLMFRIFASQNWSYTDCCCRSSSWYCSRVGNIDKYGRGCAQR